MATNQMWGGSWVIPWQKWLIFLLDQSVGLINSFLFFFHPPTKNEGSKAQLPKNVWSGLGYTLLWPIEPRSLASTNSLGQQPVWHKRMSLLWKCLSFLAFASSKKEVFTTFCDIKNFSIPLSKEKGVEFSEKVHFFCHQTASRTSFLV
jgi:hypothetical protein